MKSPNSDVIPLSVNPIE